ncbi:DUF924 family protein [Sphingomonas sp. Mn802worker]|uniref:DUF924 family protein n=1 Tax=Sphingomonas sp. Mn802worker TaxID=629773 RepID=UPI0003650D7D|nr:DUF924 family protein [Sphingomonas sp. Mn802worker]
MSTAPQDVLDFWSDRVTPEQRFAKDDALDRMIATRFGATRDAVLASDAAGWRDTPEALLAAIILLDQFSRNIHRGKAEAFAADGLARDLTLEAIRRGWEDRYTPEQRQFLYMPLMHAEDAELQALSVEKFEQLGDEEALSFARDHRDVQARYGRFPSRNAALGRTSSPEEQEYLSQPAAGW